MNRPPLVREIDAAQAAGLAGSGQVLLLDVRENDEWANGRAAGAMHIPLGSLTLEAVPTDRPVVAVCRSGHRSGAAAQALAAAGVDVRNLRGGMLAWAAAGFPVVREDATEGMIV